MNWRKYPYDDDDIWWGMKQGIGMGMGNKDMCTGTRYMFIYTYILMCGEYKYVEEFSLAKEK